MNILKIALVLICFLSTAAAVLVDKKMLSRKQKYENLLESVPAEINIENLEQEQFQLQKETAGLLKAFGFAGPREEIETDKSIYYAQKVSGLEKRLRKKAQENGVVPPNIKLPKSIPSERKATSYLDQLKTLEDIVDKGIMQNIDFYDVSIVDISNEEKEQKIEKNRLQISFGGKGQALQSFILSLVQTYPIVLIETMTADVSLQEARVTMQLAKYIFDEGIDRELKLKDADPVDYRQYAILSAEEKERFFNADFLKGKKEPVVKKEVEIEKKEEPAKQQFKYKGCAAMKGKKVAFIENMNQGEIFFLEEGSQQDGFIVRTFNEERAILVNIKTGREEILKREL